ncbi:MAG TPA: ATP-dependent endonuclease [Porphyromonadaceae bacterium]|nr:ATP-dependent endonuclease [Porphyromonadaceae bacterium]
MAQLPYEPNDDQLVFIVAMGRFVFTRTERALLVLNGYAGTGKTSLTGAIVKVLTSWHHRCVLLAPTGRAAHIFTEYSGHTAYTIHRKIYRQHSYGSDTFGLAENKHVDTLFIVDEASMIASNTADGATLFGTGRLLDDLITYVYSGQGCRLLLMGDGAQLPPVGQTSSPALDVALLQGYGLNVGQVTLRQVARQAQQSGILFNATLLRQAMEHDVLTAPQLQLDGWPDIESTTGEWLMETLSDCYDRDGMEQTIVVTRSNRRASMFNTGIRNRILYREELLVPGDMLIVAKNNYHWAQDYEQMDFVANGDVCRITRVWGDAEARYGLQFANVTVVFPDHDNLEMDVKIVLDTLLSDSPALSRQQSEQLFNEVMAELPGDKRSRYKALKEHPYYNALQVKFAYAVTCHKAQGGQWRNVFVDMGAIMPDAMETLDYHRWLYTALTRATSHVYLIG